MQGPQVEGLNQKLHKLEVVIQEKEVQIKVLENELEKKSPKIEIEERVVEVVKECDHAQEIEDLQSPIEKLQAASFKHRRERKGLEKKSSNLESEERIVEFVKECDHAKEIEDLQEQIEILRAASFEYERERDEVKEELKKVKIEFKIQIREPTGDSKQEADKTQSEKEVLSEQFIHLKAENENIVVELRSQIAKLKEELEKERGRALNIEQESHQKLEELETLRFEIHNIKTEPNATIEDKHKLHEKIDQVKQESKNEHKQLEDITSRPRVELENAQKLDRELEGDLHQKYEVIKKIIAETEDTKNVAKKTLPEKEVLNEQLGHLKAEEEEEHLSLQLYAQIEKLKKEHEGERNRAQHWEPKMHNIRAELSLTKEEKSKLHEEIQYIRQESGDKLKELEDIIAQLRPDHENQQKAVHELQDQLHKRNEEIEKPKTKQEQQGSQIRELQGKVEELEGDIFLRESEIEKLKEELQEFTKQKGEQGPEIRPQIDVDAKAVDRPIGHGSGPEALIKEKEQEIMHGPEFEGLKHKLRELEVLIQEKEVQIKALQNELEKKSSKIEIEERIIEVVKECDHAQEIEDLKGQIEILRVASFKHGRERKELDKKSLNVESEEKIVEVVKECNHTQEIEDLQEKIEILRTDSFKYERERDEAKEELKKVKIEFEIQIREPTGDSKQEADKTQSEKEFSSEQFIHLKAENENIPTEILKLKEELEKERGRAVNSEQESNHKHEELEADKHKQLEDIIAQLRVELENAQKLDSELEGDLHKKDEVIGKIIAETENAKKEAESLKAEEEEHLSIKLHAQINQLKDNLENERERDQHAEREMQNIRVELDLTKQENHKLQEEIERLKIDVQKELDAPSVDIEEKPADKTKACNHGPKIRELQGKLEQLEGDISLKESEIEKLKEEVEELRKQNREHGPKIRPQIDVYVKADDRLMGHEPVPEAHIKEKEKEMMQGTEVEGLNHKLHELEVVIQEKEVQIKALQNELENKSSNIEIEDKIVEIVKECNHAQEIEDLQEQVEILRAASFEYERERDEVKEELKKVKIEFEIQIREPTGDSKHEADKTQSEKEVLSEQFIHLKAENENIVVELRSQIAKLKEELEKERGTALNFEQESNHKHEELEAFRIEIDNINLMSMAEPL